MMHLMTDLGMAPGEFGSDGKEQIDDGMYDALDDRLGDGPGSVVRVVIHFHVL